MFQPLPKKAERGELVERNANLLIREHMDRKDLVKDLKVLSMLLDLLKKKARKSLKDNRKIRKLLKLPNTVHNKTSLKNYLNSTKRASNQEKIMARSGGFLSGPTGVHSTQKIRKHTLKRGVTRDMNSAAGTLVNTKDPYSVGAFRYSAAPKGVGPRYGKTANPKGAKFGKRGAGRILPKRGR